MSQRNDNELSPAEAFAPCELPPGERYDPTGSETPDEWFNRKVREAISYGRPTAKWRRAKQPLEKLLRRRVVVNTYLWRKRNGLVGDRATYAQQGRPKRSRKRGK